MIAVVGPVSLEIDQSSETREIWPKMPVPSPMSSWVTDAIIGQSSIAALSQVADTSAGVAGMSRAIRRVSRADANDEVVATSPIGLATSRRVRVGHD